LNRLQSDLAILIILPQEHSHFQKLIAASPKLRVLTEPVDLTMFSQRILEATGLSTPLDRVIGQDELRNQGDYSHLLGLSPKMKEIMMIINQVAPTNIKVLIRGESGTGKELVARTLYARSLRKDKPFIKVLCAALPEGLLESELFGYEKGAFTGALRRKPGKFEFANHGTIFLDEIGEISPGLQAKLLQVLQDGEFSRVGGETDVKVDTRVLAATNKNLEKAVADGTFREDLFYRINVVSVFLPPLRERKEEIPYLVEYFLEKFNHQYNKRYPRLSENTLHRFLQYEWPGNVRELENIVKRIVVLDNEDIVFDKAPAKEEGPTHIPSALPTPAAGSTASSSPPVSSYSLKSVGKEAASQAERDLIRNILYQTHWNRKRAAELLQISYKALLYKIKKYDLNNAG
ncbi:MAG TPA: sigma 54-interacting transcriptional regulator, partial [Nitrospiria bacterium]|nr:sigma 54-interacting transcriptional regulator [Nitrospiria bacterium]